MRNYLYLCVPALLIRYAILRKPLSTPHAAWVSILVHFLGVGWMVGNGTSLSAWSVGAAVCTSFLILWSGKDYHDEPPKPTLSEEEKKKKLAELESLVLKDAISIHEYDRRKREIMWG